MREDLSLPRGWTGNAWYHQPHVRLHRRHHHDELEFNLVVRGTARYLLDDRRYDLGAGCLVWLFPSQEHLLVDLSPDFACWIAVIRPSALRAACGTQHPELLVADAPGHFCRRLSLADVTFLVRLCMDIDQARAVDLARFNAGIPYLHLAAWQCYDATTDAVAGVSLHPAVERAAQALSRGKEDLDAVARQAGLSSSQLSRLFHRQLGQTMVAYRGRIRVQRFLELQGLHPGRSLLALAMSAGFGSYAQFHRTFRRSMGVSPQHWTGPPLSATQR